MRDENARLDGILKRYVTKTAELKAAISDMARRLDCYENLHSQPSQNSIPTRQRKAAARGSGTLALHKKAPGRRKGHAWVSHGRRPDGTECHRPERCSRCGSTDMRYGRPVSKTVTDLARMPELETVQHVSYPAITQRDLAEAAGVTEVTIRNRYKGFKNQKNFELNL